MESKAMAYKCCCSNSSSRNCLLSRLIKPISALDNRYPQINEMHCLIFPLKLCLIVAGRYTFKKRPRIWYTFKYILSYIQLM